MSNDRTRRKFRWLALVPRLWVALVVLLLLWQITTDSGLPALAAEWQYDNLGSHHPAITFLLLLLLLCSPVLIWNRTFRPKAALVIDDPDKARLENALLSAVGLRRIVTSLSFITAFCALIIGMYAFFLPVTGGDVKRVVVTGTELAPASGPTLLEGRVLTNKIAVLNEGLLAQHHLTRFAPVIDSASNQSKFRFFVELPPQPASGSEKFATPQIGFLRKGGLPDGLAQLYRSAGFTVGQDYYVLFPSSAAMRQPYLIDMAEFLLTSLALGILAMFVAYYVRRLKSARLIQEA